VAGGGEDLRVARSGRPSGNSTSRLRVNEEGRPMDRDEAIRLLKGGTEGITEWNRRRHEEGIPDLGGADLTGAQLERADLEGAQLKRAQFKGANLERANLKDARLEWADLTGARLEWADLTGAQLGYAVLKGVEFQGAMLTGANLFTA